jgi:hypothetical protein
MKSSITRIITILAVGFTFGTAQAAPKKPAATEAEKPASTEKPAAADKTSPAKRNTYPLYGQVVAVTARTLTIKGGEGKEDRKYAITTATTFNNAGKPATIDDVVVGKKVGGLLEKSDTGNDKVLKLNVGVSQEAAARKGKAGDKKGAKSEAAPGTEPAQSTAKKKSA